MLKKAARAFELVVAAFCKVVGPLFGKPYDWAVKFLKVFIAFTGIVTASVLALIAYIGLTDSAPPDWLLEAVLPAYEVLVYDGFGLLDIILGTIGIAFEFVFGLCKFIVYWAPLCICYGAFGFMFGRWLVRTWRERKNPPVD